MLGSQLGFTAAFTGFNAGFKQLGSQLRFNAHNLGAGFNKAGFNTGLNKGSMQSKA